MCVDVLRLSLVPSIATRICSLAVQRLKSNTLLCLRVIDAETQNQEQMDMLFGSVRDGSVKNCFALPSSHALYEVEPKGPSTIWVGEFGDATRFPVMPVMSLRKSP